LTRSSLRHSAPLIVVHVVVFLLPPSPTVEIVYMLGYATSLAIASTHREYKHPLVIPAASFIIGLVAEVIGL